MASSTPGLRRTGRFARRLLLGKPTGSRRGGQQGGHPLQCRRDEPVVDPGSAALAVDDPRFPQHLKVMADGRLGQLERRAQIADADLAALMGPDQGNQPQADRVPEGPEYLRQPGGSGLADRLTDQGRGAPLQGSAPAHSGRPASTLLYLDVYLSSLAS